MYTSLDFINETFFILNKCTHDEQKKVNCHGYANMADGQQ
jgi:hypothetical protein